MQRDEDNLDREVVVNGIYRSPIDALTPAADRARDGRTATGVCISHGPFNGPKCPACSAYEAFTKADAAKARATKGNATFHAFKDSGKWYTTERGNFTESVLAVFSREARREQILADNDGKYPGLSGRGVDLVFVVIPDADVPFGYPLMLLP